MLQLVRWEVGVYMHKSRLSLEIMCLKREKYHRCSST